MEPADLPVPLDYDAPISPDLKRRKEQQEDAQEARKLARRALSRTQADLIAQATNASRDVREQYRSVLLYASDSVADAESLVEAIDINTVQLLIIAATMANRRDLITLHTAIDAEAKTALDLAETQRLIYARAIAADVVKAKDFAERLRIAEAAALLASSIDTVSTAFDLAESTRQDTADVVKALLAPMVASLVEEALARRVGF